MGRVYEALKKSKKEHTVLAGLQADTSDSVAAAAARQKSDEFDFVDYSLNMPSAVELEQSQQDMVIESLERRAQTRPAREATLDVNRIDPHLVAFYDFDPRAADQYNKLAAAVISSASERKLKRLLITSAQSGEGRTCVALNLACALANAKQRVAVVDADFNRPSVLRLLGLEAELGIAEAVEQDLPAGSAAIKVQPYGFVVLPTREQVENSAHLLASSVLPRILSDLDSEYDFILFDSSPLLNSSDSYLLARLTDAAVMVVRSGKTYSRHLDEAIAPLTEESIFGVVINRAEQ